MSPPMTNPKLILLPQLGKLLLPMLLVASSAVVLITLAYQVRPGYALNMANDYDRFFLHDGWHEVEQNEQFSFRWTEGYATARFKGVARQPLRLALTMRTGGPDPQPNKKVEIYARGALVAVFDATNTLADFAAPISPDLISRATGDLDLIITSPSFKPAGDPRQLGVIVTSMRLEPIDDAFPILPPAFHLLYVMGAGFCVYLICALLRLPTRIRLAASLLALLAIAAYYAFARAAIALYMEGLLWALALTLVTLLAAQPLVRWLYRRAGFLDFDFDRREAQALFGIFAAGLAVGWAGLLHPQSDPHDFTFHLRSFQEVQAGNVFFDNYVVAGVGQGFYPPAMYVLLLPFNLLMRNPYYLVRLVPVLISFSGVFIVYLLARRYMPQHKLAPLMSAALYAALPVNLLILWWAHETNLFGLVLLLGTIAYILSQYERIARWHVWLGLVALLFVVLLSHPGVLVWTVVLVGSLIVTFLGLKRFTGRGSYRSVLAIAVAFLLAGGLAFALYYSHYTGSFGEAAYTRADRVSELGETISNLGDINGILSMARLTLYHGVLSDYGVVPLLLVPLGLALLFRKRNTGRQDAPPPTNLEEAQAERFRWTLLIWMLVGVLFLIISLLTALPIRPMLLMWPIVALLAGLTLSAFLKGAQAGTTNATLRAAATGVLLAALAGMSLYFWALANFLGYRLPHVYPHVF
ncbi:MAG TPA: hypothetical protein VEW94_00265 [Chloroflexia bacterium]|nr:hypothetical protein [Chloroflexia bacterium]